MLSAGRMLKVDTKPKISKQRVQDYQDITQVKETRAHPETLQIFGFEFQPQQSQAVAFQESKLKVMKSQSQNNLGKMAKLSQVNLRKLPDLSQSDLHFRQANIFRNHSHEGQIDSPRHNVLHNNLHYGPFFSGSKYMKPLSFSDEDYYIGTEVQQALSDSKREFLLQDLSKGDSLRQETEIASFSVLSKGRTVSEQMTGVTGLMSLSVRLGDVCNLSSLERHKEESEQQESKALYSVEQPTIRVLSGIKSAQDKKLLLEIGRGLKSQQEVLATNEGLGGTYFFKNERGENVAIVKPIDEEALAPNNPKGYVGRQLGNPGWKSSIRVGEAAVRELVAYLLDYNNEAKVPPTILAKIKHQAFNVNDSQAQDEKLLQKIVSVQRYIQSDGDCSDIGSANFLKKDVQRIALLDIRIFNTDRHAGNLLYLKNRYKDNQLRQQIISGDSSYELTPIDHGFCLPESLECPYFEWLYWPQVALPLDQELKQMVLDIDVDRDIQMLRDQIPQQILRKGILRMYYFSATFLKTCVKAGLTLFEIGRIMSEPVFDDCQSGDNDNENEITDLIKCANCAITQMEDIDQNQDNRSTSNTGDNLSNGEYEYTRTLRVGVISGISGGNSQKSMKSQGSKTCSRGKTFTLPEDKQVEYQELGFEWDSTPKFEGGSQAPFNMESEGHHVEQGQPKGLRRSSFSLSDICQELSYQEMGFNLETPTHQHTIQQSPFNKLRSSDLRDSISSSPDELDFEQKYAKSLAHDSNYLSSAMRNRTNPVIPNNKTYAQPQRVNSNLKFARYKHLFSNYLKGNKGQPILESICFENFTDKEFSLFMDSFKEVLQSNLDKGMYREEGGVDTSRYACSLPY